MNLLDHVLGIRLLIHRAFSGKMERIGIGLTQYEERNGLSKEDTILRQRLINVNNTHLQEKNGDYKAARDYTLKQCVFTLFNRLAAIKLMEQKQLFPEVIKQRAENGGLSASHQMWLEEHPEGRSMERDGLVPFLVDKFQEMAELNFLLYEVSYPYAIMPTADELNEIFQAFNAIENDPECADAWKKDDILGWLYENFNSAEKVEFKKSKAKTEFDKVSLQSQVYTPSWVVKFLVDNTLGKMYLEMFPDSQLDMPDVDGFRRYPIANRPNERKRRPKDMRELKFIDPACGSGNFLLYAFSLLYDMYIEQIELYGKDYNKRDIPALIVENNLYGVDLDERAVQLAQIGLLIKAREVGGRRARMPQHTHVVCSNFYLPSYEEVKADFGYESSWDKKYDDTARKIWTDLSEAYKFGTLVRVEEVLKDITPTNDNLTLFSGDEITSLFDEKSRLKTQLHNLVSKYGEQNNNPYSLLKMNEAMTFLDVVSTIFDVVVANPPYTDKDDFGKELKKFVEENYRRPMKFNSNLYACFIKRCCELAGENGKVGMIHPMTFMYIKSFEDVRKFMLDNTHINLFVEYGLSNLFGVVMVDPAFYVLDMNKKSKENSIFISLDQYTRTPEEKNKKQYCLQALSDIVNNEVNKHVYILPQSKLKSIKSYPFIYWISDEFREKFIKCNLSSVGKVLSGLKTGNNESTVRFWWEVVDNVKWARMTKGGPFNRWYGNTWTKVNVENDFELIKKQKSYSIPSVRGIECITFPTSGSGRISFRMIDADTIYNNASNAINSTNNKLLLGVLNSKMTDYALRSLNPTVNTTVGDIQRIPLFDFNNISSDYRLIITNHVTQNIDIKKFLLQYSLIEEVYKQSPIGHNYDTTNEILNFYSFENALLTLILLNESIINQAVFEVYNLNTHDKKMVLDKEGVPVGDLPVSYEAKNAYRQWLKEENDFKASDEMLQHLESLKESVDLPRISDFDVLYLTNKGWEEFCILHKMNPVEVWWQFKNSGILPPQRTQTLAFELITDVIRSLLDKDDDGVIPLTTNAGETNIAPRIESEMVDRGYSAAQIAQIFGLLGDVNLERYLQEKFFQQLSDHLNLFMYLPKTPFIWHITTGPHHALELYVSIYKWNRDTLMRIKSVYAANREAALNDRLQVLLQGDAMQKAEAAEVRAQLKELTKFSDKIDNLLASGYNPKLDDGVAKNIAPLQKVGIISYDVLTKEQLSKYLNADW